MSCITAGISWILSLHDINNYAAENKSIEKQGLGSVNSCVWINPDSFLLCGYSDQNIGENCSILCIYSNIELTEIIW